MMIALGLSAAAKRNPLFQEGALLYLAWLLVARFVDIPRPINHAFAGFKTVDGELATDKIFVPIAHVNRPSRVVAITGLDPSVLINDAIGASPTGPIDFGPSAGRRVARCALQSAQMHIKICQYPFSEAWHDYLPSNEPRYSILRV